MKTRDLQMDGTHHDPWVPPSSVKYKRFKRPVSRVCCSDLISDPRLISRIARCGDDWEGFPSGRVRQLERADSQSRRDFLETRAEAVVMASQGRVSRKQRRRWNPRSHVSPSSSCLSCRVAFTVFEVTMEGNPVLREEIYLRILSGDRSS